MEDQKVCFRRPSFAGKTRITCFPLALDAWDQLNIHPCLCSRSCLWWYRSRPCLCRSSGPYRRAFLSCLWSPSCRTLKFCPCRRRCFALWRSHLFQQQIRRELHQPAVLALTSSCVAPYEVILTIAGKRWRTRRVVSAGPPLPGNPKLLVLFHWLTVCPAFTLAFAVVLAFGSAAAALALAGVLALTRVLFFLAFGRLLARVALARFVAASVLRDGASTCSSNKS